MGNRDTVIGIYDAFGRGDVPWILAQLDDDIEWEPGIRDTGIAYWRSGRGKAHVAEFFGNLAANLELTHFEPEAICDGGAIISVPVRHAGRITGGGDVPMQEEVHVWRFGPNGKVIAFNHILDMAVHERAAAVRSKRHEGSVFDVVGDRIEVLQSGEQFEVFSLTGTKDAGPPPHSHPWMESYFGLAGEVELMIEGEVQVLRSADFARAGRHPAHVPSADGRRPFPRRHGRSPRLGLLRRHGRACAAGCAE